MFDSIFGVILATIIVIVFAAASNQFHGLGFLVGRPMMASKCHTLIGFALSVADTSALRDHWSSICLLRLIDGGFTPRGIRCGGWVPDHYVYCELRDTAVACSY